MSLNRALAISLQARKNMEGFLSRFTEEQINAIPGPFANNLAWNYIHSICTLELLTLGLTGYDLSVPMEKVALYRKGTVPTEYITTDDLANWKERSMRSIQHIQEKLDKGDFDRFKPYQTSYGMELQSVDDALAFNTVHEGLHLGYMLALAKSL